MEPDKLDYETAIMELAFIQEIFDTEYDENDTANLIPAIMAGRFIADSEKQIVKYILAKPFDLENGQRFTEVSFRAPSYEDFIVLNKGIEIKTDPEGNSIMNFGAIQERAFKAAVRLAVGTPHGVIKRISRKDMKVIAGLFNFFD